MFSSVEFFLVSIIIFNRLIGPGDAHIFAQELKDCATKNLQATLKTGFDCSITDYFIVGLLEELGTQCPG